MFNMKFTILFVFLLGLYIVLVSSDDDYICDGDNVFGRDSADCSKWFKCSHGKATAMKPCSAEMVYSLKALNCVAKDSELDDCDEAEKNPQGKCSHGIYFTSSKSDNCAQFINNCLSKTDDLQPEYLGEKVGECPYPKLFSEETKQCEDFESVECGQRKEIIYACDYKKLHCPSTDCKPCSFDYPDCRTLPDGMNEWVGMEGTSKYASCYKGRGSPMECTKNYLFSPDTKKCEHEKDFVGSFIFKLF